MISALLFLFVLENGSTLLVTNYALLWRVIAKRWLRLCAAIRQSLLFQTWRAEPARQYPCMQDGKKDSSTAVISLAIMPFKYEADRIFSAGTALRRVREVSDSTIVMDNDAFLDNNQSCLNKIALP